MRPSERQHRIWLRTEDHAPRRQLEERLGLAPGVAEFIVFNSDAGLRTQRGEFTEEENWLRVQAELGLSDADLADFRREFWAGDKLDCDLIDYIRRLHGRYQTAIISNAMPGLMALVNGKYPIADAFDVIVGSGDVKVAKPQALLLIQLSFSKNPALAGKFIDFVASPEGQAVFRKYGFLDNRQHR